MTRPSSVSRVRIADDNAGWDTWHASAARAKCFSLANVTRYSSWRMNIAFLGWLLSVEILHAPSHPRVSDEQVLVKSAERTRWMHELNLQDPKPRVWVRLEIAEIARLVNGVRKIADAMPLDVEIQFPSQRVCTFGGVVIKRLAARAGRAPVMFDFIEDSL